MRDPVGRYLMECRVGIGEELSGEIFQISLTERYYSAALFGLCKGFARHDVSFYDDIN